MYCLYTFIALHHGVISKSLKVNLISLSIHYKSQILRDNKMLNCRIRSLQIMKEFDKSMAASDTDRKRVAPF